MLNEFIVLGQIPGTNLQITFSEMMLMLDIALVVALIHKKRFVMNRVKYLVLYAHLYFAVRRSHQLLKLPA